MPSSFRLQSGLVVRSCLVATLFCAVVSSSHASTIAVTYDPGVVVAGAQQFTADTLNSVEYAREDLTGNNFTEAGYLQVNNVTLNNNVFDPSGNRSSYSLYLAFSATGTMSLPNFNGSSTGLYNTFNYTLYEAPGASSFAINGSNLPSVTTSGTPVAVATGSLVDGTVSFSNSPLGFGSNLDATFAQELAGFIASPVGTTLSLSIAENADPGTITVLNGGQSVLLNGSGADLMLTGTPPVAATPEPSGLALLGTGILGLAGVVRRRLA